MKKIKVVFFIIGVLLIICISRLSIDAQTSNEKSDNEYFAMARKSVADYQIIYQILKTDIVNTDDRLYTVYIDEFSGAYLDDEGLLNILFSNKVEEEKISVLINEIYENTGNDKIIYGYADYTYNYLQQILLNLEKIMEKYEIYSVGIDDKINKVFIESNIDNEQQIKDYLQEINYYDSNSIVYYYNESLSISTDAFVAHSGESVYYNDSSGISRGTIGALAVRNDNGQLGLITNEHVAPLGTTMYYGEHWDGTWFSKGVAVGNSALAQNYGTIDAAFVPFQTPIDWEITPYSRYNLDTYENIRLGNESQIVRGQPVLRIGQTTGVTTGEIKSSNVSATTNGTVKTNLFRYTNDGQGGDSGGPVFYNDGINLYLLGLHFCSGDVFLGGRQGFACRVFNIMSELGVTPITNDSFYTTDLLDGTIQLNGINFSVAGEFNIPSSVKGKIITEIGNSAFQYYSSLTEVVLPNTVTNIDSYAFNNCTNLSNVTIQKEEGSLINLGLSVFDNCASNLTITVPTNRVCEYKNTPFWSSYRDKIVPSSPVVDDIDLDCMVDDDVTTYLNAGYNKLYRLDVECDGWYTISCTSGTYYSIYNSNMVKIAGAYDTYELTLNEGTYYIDVEWEDPTVSGNATLHFLNKGINVSDNITNNILPHLHNVGTNYKAQLKYYHTQGAGYYKFSLTATSSNSNPVEYIFGAITMYTAFDRNDAMNKYSDNKYTLSAESLAGENSMVVYLPSNGYYYFDVKMNTNSLSSLVLNITPYISSNIDLFDCSVSSNHDIHIINTNVKGDYFQKKVLKQKGKFIISFTYTDPDPNNISSSDVVVVVTKVTYNANTNTYSFTKVYSVDFCEEDLLFTSYIITNSLDLDAGTYYIGYFNNTDCANIKVDFGRQITQYGSYNLISDPNSSEEYGSEVRFNNGSYLGSTLTVGFTGFIYLNYGYILPSYSRLDYYFYSSNDSIASISEYGTLLGKSAGTVKIMAVYKSDPSITFVKQFTVLADNRINNLIIYDTESIDYTGSGQIYQIELDDYNSYFPQISLYNWSLISSSNNYSYSISEWGTFSLYGEDIIVIEGTSQLNSKLKIRITITVTN